MKHKKICILVMVLFFQFSCVDRGLKVNGEKFQKLGTTSIEEFYKCVAKNDPLSFKNHFNNKIELVDNLTPDSMGKILLNYFDENNGLKSYSFIKTKYKVYDSNSLHLENYEMIYKVIFNNRDSAIHHFYFNDMTTKRIQEAPLLIDDFMAE